MNREDYPVLKAVDYAAPGAKLTVEMLDKLASRLEEGSRLPGPERIVIGPWKGKEEYEEWAKAYAEYLVGAAIEQGIL